jgi:hypothetical protein
VALTLLGNGSGTLTLLSIENLAAVIIACMILGAVLGRVSEKVASLLTGGGSGACAKV